MEQMIKWRVVIAILVGSTGLTFGQEAQDSLKSKQLNEVVVKGVRLNDLEQLPKVSGTRIWSGTKNEVINLQNLDANVAERNPRQIFAKVPGVFVYDMDGTGNQMNISTRGLDPHRGWEFNLRKNGTITNSDMYGYPASHFSVPMEAVERIELVRGTGSLQYGAQFGGMLNYITKEPDSTRRFSFESVNSIGSFGLLSTYNAVGGTIGKFRYYAYYNKRVSDGYRDNSQTDFDAQAITLIYSPSKRVDIKAEVSRSNYIYQIPGPLTDSMFYADPNQSTRARNYFNPEIYIPSLSVDWQLGLKTKLYWMVSAVLGDRNSVQFDRPANIPDVIDPVTLTYAPRQVDIDNFNSYTSELRLLHSYRLGKIDGALVGGVQLFDNDLHRKQLGTGTTGTDFDLTISSDGWGRDLHFKTKNIALFAENAFTLKPGLTITPGARLEIGESDMSGVIKYYDPGDLPNSIDHNFLLLGIKADYMIKPDHNLYGGWSQAYRPVMFKDIIPASTYEVVDKNLQDADGYNMEAGYRGSWKSIRWDVNAFRIQYNNRMGTLSETNPNDGSFYLYRTNIGNSVTNGAEVFLEWNLTFKKGLGITLFTSTAFMDATYQGASVRSGNENINVSGNKVESVPEVISRNGLTFRYHDASLSFLYSYTAESYADALNTETPSATGSVGLVPSYGLLDINATIRFANNLVARINFNNVTNEQYFTKRPQMYPGPGVWSSDGRSFSVSLGIKI